MKFKNSSIIIDFLFLVLAYRALSRQVEPNTTRCDLKAEVACIRFKVNQGKLCALSPAIYYDKDDVTDNKNCSPDTASYCQTFKDNNGFLCTVFYCLITANNTNSHSSII